ncbi:MAG TPA: hypothetical protein DIU09_03895 [Hyphomonadaceae bacterium]|nr:hypothetical protein AEM38_09805 [Hyphomonadaceae bacterium UKL13-1]HCP63714.1 hypothetical protein [Hyphomonadaceae bacterium]
MSITALSSGTPEAQFEAQVRAAILHALPWLPSDGVTHQKSFSFQFGHATVTVKAEAKTYIRARADVLVLFKGKHLAIFELKRPGEKLTTNDNEQGLSYARMLHPRPPLVVLSNGKDVRILETHSGEVWQPESKSELALAALIAAGTEVAQADLKRAVETLMGSDPDVWVQALRQATAHAIEELTGDWEKPISPFVRGFLMPRKAVHLALQLLEDRNRLVTIEGGPLSGKSNALRELASSTASHEKLVVLYLDADVDIDLFERLALLLGDALDWPLTAAEARQWLVKLSRANGPALVLAIDNVGPDRHDLRRDLEILTSNLFGPALRMALAIDDGIAEQLMTRSAGRGPSALNNRARRIDIGPLDNEEFEVAERHLSDHRLSFAIGARHNNHLRAPWIIRAMATDAATSPKYQNDELMAVMSPVPGLDVIDHARRIFDVSQSPFARYRELAKAVLTDCHDRTRPYELILESLETFVVRRETVLAHLSGSDVQQMLDSGLIRETRSESGENVFVIRLPELMASELAQLLAEELPNFTRDDAGSAATWLAETASNLPLGDVIAAQAIIDATLRGGWLSLQLITELLKRAPTQTTFSSGTRTAGWMPGVGIFNMTFKGEGAILLEHQGQEHLVRLDESDEGEHVAISDLEPYLILSHLAGHRLELMSTDTTPAYRLDPVLLVRVGSTPLTVRRPGGCPEVSAVPVHEISGELSVVCHKAGVVESVTWSLVRFFGREDETERDQFINFALDGAEPALLPRLDIALQHIAGSADKARAAWAASIRVKRIQPLLNQILEAYVHS